MSAMQGESPADKGSVPVDERAMAQEIASETGFPTGSLLKLCRCVPGQPKRPPLRAPLATLARTAAWPRQESRYFCMHRPHMVSRVAAHITHPPARVLSLLFRTWVVCMGLSMLKGGHGAPSLLGVTCGTPGYWGVVGLNIPVLAFLTWIAGRTLTARHTRLVSIGYTYAEGWVQHASTWLCPSLSRSPAHNLTASLSRVHVSPTAGTWPGTPTKCGSTAGRCAWGRWRRACSELVVG